MKWVELSKEEFDDTVNSLDISEKIKVECEENINRYFWKGEEIGRVEQDKYFVKL